MRRRSEDERVQHSRERVGDLRARGSLEQTKRKRAHPETLQWDDDDLTDVELVWVKKRTENYIRFGHAAAKRTLDRSRRIVSFEPGNVFAFVRWTANEFGTTLSRIDILRPVLPGQRCSTVASVRPGADILLSTTGWPNVEKVLTVIDQIEALGIDAADVAPDHWRHVHGRFAARETPRPYTRQRHEAWLLRRAIEL